MYGKRFNWATLENRIHDGLNTKFEPPASQKQTGYIPRTVPSPARTNWLIHQLTQTNKWIRGFRTQNWHLSDFDRISPAWNNQDCHAICYDKINKSFTAINQEGTTIFTREDVSDPLSTPFVGGDGVSWDDDFSTPSAILNSVTSPVVDIACDHINGDRVAVQYGGDPGDTDLIAVSPQYGTWIDGAPSQAVVKWSSVAHDHVGKFFIAGFTGFGAIIESSTSGTGWQSVTGVSDLGPPIIRSSKDPDNYAIISIGEFYSTLSTDGILFTSYTHGLPTGSSIRPVCLDYSIKNKTWITLLQSGQIGISGNNGINWRSKSIFEITKFLSQHSLLDFPRTDASLACDGGDEWIIYLSSYTGINAGLFVSTDNGENWTRVSTPWLAEMIGGKVAYGNGRFVIVGRDESGHTVRAVEV